MRADSTVAAGPAPVRLVWLNSPANPTGRVLPADHLRKVVDWARERGAVVASDECYLDFGWEAEPVSVLHPSVTGGDHTGVLAVHSLSKRSNLAGYRAGFVAGDPALVADLLEVRKHAGLIVPEPVQAAATAAYADDAHVAAQRDRYAAPPGPAPAGAGEGRLHRRALRGRALPVGDPRPGLLARGRRAGRAGASWSRPACSTARPAPGTCGSR